MLAGETKRADIQGLSTTTINFTASVALAVRPIRLWAPSGRQAALTALPTALTISGAAGTRYVYASLSAPSGDPYSTSSPGILYRILNALPWNRLDWQNGFRAIHPGDGTLIDPARSSAVTLVETASATPPDTHHVSLGQFEVAAGEITSITSYESQVSITVSAFIHGQCILELSGGNLVLKARDGQNLVIDGTARAVPVAGVSLAPTGLTPGQLYRIYAAWSGSAVTTEPSTTAETTHTNGVDIKTADSTRTYVGEAWIVSGPAWSTIVPVRSRFHDPTPDLLVLATGNPFADVANTAVETSLLGTAPNIKGGALGTDGFLDVDAEGDLLKNGSHDLTIRVKYGGTTFATFTFTSGAMANNATRRLWRFRCRLSASGSASLQYANGLMTVLAPGVGATDLGQDNSQIPRGSGRTGGTVTSASDQPVDVTAQWSGASVNSSVRLHALTARGKPR